MPTFFDEGRPHNGLTYEEYRDYWKEQMQADLDEANPKQRRLHHYLNYNWDRQERVHALYEPSDQLKTAVEEIDEPQLWMVLTEPWCGDSAFLLPVIAEAASMSDALTLRILLRDDNLDIMDQYLTNGSRSIPKLVAFSEEGNERFTWGPRPEQAARRYRKLDEKYEDKRDVITELMEYYENGGWKEADTELAEVIRSSVPTSRSAAE